ncbi:MAG: Acetylxylan esterase precursor [Planctomycetota bacterium]
MPNHRIAFALTLVMVMMTGLLTTSVSAQTINISPDVVYGHKHGVALTFDVFEPVENSNGAAVLFMVSGGWFSSWNPPEKAQGMFKPLTDKGFTVFSVRHGSSPKFTIPEIVEDVRLSVRYVRHHAKRFGIDPNRIGVYGLSAGGHLSLMLGTTADQGNQKSPDPVLQTSDSVQAVCAWVAPTDLRIMAWSDPAHDPVYNRFPGLDLTQNEAAQMSPLVSVSSDDAPTLLIAGDKDNLVPVSHSQRLKKAFDDKGVENRLFIVEGAGHGFQGDDLKRAVDEMVKWFEQKLSQPKP